MVIRSPFDHHLERVHGVDRFHRPRLVSVLQRGRERIACVELGRQRVESVQPVRRRDIGGENAGLGGGRSDNSGAGSQLLSVHVGHREGGFRGTASRWELRDSQATPV